ncbi:hypothetical protein BWI17_21685 [Betaproteobacteria bacterium GR16-43]|nr:hypothetical protein BWI17_21685 [Betaproteobacteria bacterium GR16-43]
MPEAAVIDLRGLEPPEPIVRVFDTIAQGPGPHVFLLPRSPAPLYTMLRREGWRYSECLGTEGFEVTVWRET